MKVYQINAANLTKTINALYVEINKQKAVLENTATRSKRREIGKDLYYLYMDVRIAKSKRRMIYRNA